MRELGRNEDDFVKLKNVIDEKVQILNAYQDDEEENEEG